MTTRDFTMLANVPVRLDESYCFSGGWLDFDQSNLRSGGAKASGWSS